MNYQRGGSVNGWILAALLVVALASGLMNLYQSRHRVIEISVPTQYVPSGMIPRYADSCGSPGAVCFLKI